MQNLSSTVKWLTAFSLIWMLALGAAIASATAPSGPAPSPPARPAAVDVQFATKFCYAQYNNQTDVVVCLARHLAR